MNEIFLKGVDELFSPLNMKLMQKNIPYDCTTYQLFDAFIDFTEYSDTLVEMLDDTSVVSEDEDIPLLQMDDGVLFFDPGSELFFVQYANGKATKQVEKASVAIMNG